LGFNCDREKPNVTGETVDNGVVMGLW